MKREDGRKLFRAFLGNSRETAGEQRTMMEQMAVPSRERSLYSMVEHLLSLDETAWYLYAWSRDPLEGRFSREQKLAYGFRAAECGRNEAQLKTDVWDIAAGMGLNVLTPQVPGGGGHVIFAQYQEPDSITIFMDGAERAQKLIREEKLEGLLGNRAVEDVLLAHELFHVTEYRKKDSIFTQTEKVELWKKPFSNRSRILCLGEIAGMEFARCLTGYEFLRNTDLKALPLGRVDIDGDEVFASVQEYTTMPADACRYESHDLYFDIQYVVEGQEQFGYTKRAGLEEEAPYNEADDIVFFKEPEQGGAVLLRAGDCAVVAPEDAHKPRCIAGTPCKVRKIVVKVRV